MSAIGNAILWLMLFTTLVRADDDAPAIYQSNEQFTNALANTLTVTIEFTPTMLRDDMLATLRLELRGMSNPTRVRRPPLAERAEWSELFRSISDGPTTVGEQAVTFEYRLQPRTHGTFELPSIQLDYFAPAAQQLRTKYTDSLSFSVSESNRLATPAVPRAAIVISEPQLGHWLVMVGGLIGGTIAWVVVWRWRNPDGVRLAKLRRNRAVRRVLDSLANAEHGADSSARIAETLRGYLVERHHLAVTATVPSEIAKSLRTSGMAETRIAEVLALVEACDATRFSPHAAPCDLADQLRTLVLTWENADVTSPSSTQSSPTTTDHPRTENRHSR